MNSCEFTWAFRPAHSAHGNFRGHLHLNGSRVAKVSFDAYSTCSRAPLSVARGNFRRHFVSDRSARGKSSNLDGREAPFMHIYGTMILQSRFLASFRTLVLVTKPYLMDFLQIITDPAAHGKYRYPGAAGSRPSRFVCI